LEIIWLSKKGKGGKKEDHGSDYRHEGFWPKQPPTSKGGGFLTHGGIEGVKELPLFWGKEGALEFGGI